MTEFDNPMHQNVFIIRNYHPDDFDSFVQLHMETEAHDRSGRYTSRRRLAEDLGHPRFQPEHNLWVAERDGNLIGSVGVFLEPGIGRALLDGLVHPLQRKKGIATDLFAHAIEHARQAGLKVIQICIAETNQSAQKLMKRLGLGFIRRFIGMELDLTTSPLPVITPATYTIRHLQPGEEQLLTDIQNRSFADAWGFNPNTIEEIAYRVNLGSCAPEDILMAYLEDRPIGYCWTRRFVEKHAASESMRGEIHMLGVDPDFRKQGVGRTVLLAGLSHLKDKGITIVELTTDGEDPVAFRLYETVGFQEKMISQWYEKNLV
jgi:mycothiol synthase